MNFIVAHHCKHRKLINITSKLEFKRKLSTKLTNDTTLTLNDGKRIPIIGLGTWKSKPNEAKEAVKHAIKVGYRHIDCAPVYQNEKEVGEAIKESIQNGIVKREQLFITSKLWNTNHRKNDVQPACEKSLKDLQLDYLDCYLIHWPVAFKNHQGSLYPKREDNTFDIDDVPIWETWEAMQLLKERGLTKSIGVSNFSISQIETLLEDAQTIPSINQVELHPYCFQADFLKFCNKIGIVVTGYSPLGSGQPSNKELPSLLENPKVLEIASFYKKTPAQILLRWSLQCNIVTIPKSVTPKRIEENFQIFDFTLSEDHKHALNSLKRMKRYVNPVWAQ